MTNFIYQGKWSSQELATLTEEFCLFRPGHISNISLLGEGGGSVSVVMPSGLMVSSTMNDGQCLLEVSEAVEAFSYMRFSTDDSVIITQIEILFD